MRPRYKDAASYQCKCGRLLVVPYPSMQKSPSIAPSEKELKDASHALTQEIIYHQNKECPVMHAARNEAILATKPKSILLEKGQKLIK